MRQFVYLAAVFCLIASVASGLELSLLSSDSLKLSTNLRKPSNLIQFSDTEFCFTAESCDGSSCSQEVLCSYDGGKSVMRSDTSSPFCSNHGVLVGDSLYCQGEILASTPEQYRASLVSFTSNGVTLEVRMETDASFSVTDPKRKVQISTVEMNGNSLFISKENAFLLAATIVDDAGARKPYLLRSLDGFSWEVSEALQLPEAEDLHLVAKGHNRVAVFSNSVSGYDVVTSTNLGKTWSGPQHLNTSAPPGSIILPSDVIINYFMTNSTAHTLKHNYMKDKRPVVGYTSLGDMDSVSSHVALALVNNDGAQTLLAIFDAKDAANSENGRLMMSAFAVNDTIEMDAKIQMLKKAEEAEKKKAEARLKAQKEKAELLEKKRQERLKREEERRRRFVEIDEPNLREASQRMEIDGEMVVVRHVDPSLVDLEKDTFF